jgi:hypothetical protein
MTPKQPKRKAKEDKNHVGLPSAGGIAAKRIVVSVVLIPIGCITVKEKKREIESDVRRELGIRDQKPHNNRITARDI